MILLCRAKKETNHRITAHIHSPDINFRSAESANEVWYLASGLAINTSMWARSRLPSPIAPALLYLLRSCSRVAHGPESRRHTPLATLVLSEHFTGNTTGVSRAGVGAEWQDRERHDVATEHTWKYSLRVLAVNTRPGPPPSII